MRVFPILSLYLCVQGIVAGENATNAVQLTPQLIRELSEEARTNNAALWANRARIVAARENAGSIPLWRDPTVMAGGMNAEKEMRAEDGDLVYGVEQMLPLFGKESAARNAARAEIPVEEADLDLQFQSLRKTLAQALFRAALADEILLLSQLDLAWLQTLVAAVEQRYQAGDATQVDVLRVQNERARREQQVRSDENSRHSEYVTVNRFLNRNVFAGWARMLLPEIPALVPFDDRLLGLAATNDPKLKLLRQQVQRAEAMVDLSRKEARPDLSAAVEGRNYLRTGEGRAGEFLLKMTIPWPNRDKYKAAIRRDQARVHEVENLIEDYGHELRAEVHHLTTRLENARREALLYRDEIIPRSELALRSAEAAWAASRDAFRDVLDARRMLLEFRTMHRRAVAEAHITIADLTFYLGLESVADLDRLVKSEQTQIPTPQ